MKKLILGLLFSSFLLVSCSNTNNSTNSADLQKTIDSLKQENTLLKQKLDDNNETTTDSTTSEKPELPASEEMTSLNEELSLGDGEKETAKLKIVEVTTNQNAFPSYMVSLEDYDTTKMIAVTIEYTNVAIEEPFFPYSNYFQAYDKDGSALTQVNQQHGHDAVAIGRTGKTQIFWELPINGNEFNEVEIDFVPQQKVATFDLKVTH